MRSNRGNFDTRKVDIVLDNIKNADGSCLIKFGETQVICTASFEEKVPKWLRDSGKGWVTAEYGMLPRSTHERMRRESATGKIASRTSEIQRLIGRSLRSGVDLSLLGENLITIDCDVIQADGGTRTASITGGFVALFQCINKLKKNNIIKTNPIKNFIAAVSCGVVDGDLLVDLDFAEDSNAEIDSNFVINDQGQLVEIQMTAEKNTCSDKQFQEMMLHAKKNIIKLIEYQKKILSV